MNARLRYGARSMLLELVMVATAVAFVFPIYVLVMVSLKPGSDVADDPLGLPRSAFLDNYAEAWTSASLGRALISSSTVAALSIAALVAVGALAAYAFARTQRRRGYVLYLLVLLGLMMPLQLGMVPLYALMRDLGLLQTYTALILFYTGSQLPLTIFLYAGFVRALPRSYEESALVDGASHFKAFRQVVFPLLRPVTGTVIILNAIAIWNDFLTPLLYVGGSPQQTVPVAIFSFKGEYASQWGIIFAGLVIAVIPVLVVYFLFQRHVIKGFAGGLKG